MITQELLSFIFFMLKELVLYAGQVLGKWRNGGNQEGVVGLTLQEP
jgi:hypothetical protein